MSINVKPKKPPPIKPYSKRIKVFIKRDVCEDCYACLSNANCDQCGHVNKWMLKGFKK